MFITSVLTPSIKGHPVGNPQFTLELPNWDLNQYDWQSSQRFPVPNTFFVRKSAGSDNNGGSSVNASPDMTGTDGVTVANSHVFTSASATFTSAQLDELINIVGVGRYRILVIVDSNTLVLSGNVNSATGLTWNIGGAVNSVGALLSNGNDAIREGDTIWIGSGVYREVININAAPKNGATSSILVRGDTDGVQTGDPSGPIQITAYLTNDKTAASNASLLDFASGVSGFSFQNILFVAGPSGGGSSGRGSFINAGFVGVAAAMGPGNKGTIQNITLQDCTVLLGGNGAGTLISVTPNAATPLNWTIDRCIMSNGGSAGPVIYLSVINTGNAIWGNNDTNLNVNLTNSAFYGAALFTIAGANTGILAGANTGGVTIRNVTVNRSAATVCAQLNTIPLSSVYPIRVNNSIFLGCSGNILSNAGGNTATWSEDYNFLQSSSPRVSVSIGAHSISDVNSYAPLIHMGQELQWGGLLRLFGEPMSGSPLLGFGNDGNQSLYDLRNNPKPAGGGSNLSGIGALERSNTYTKETTTVHTGTNAISAIGPAYQDFLVAVASGTSYTFSIWVNYDANYTGIAPRFSILSATEVGLAAQIVTAGGSAGGGWTQINLSPVTPTSSGFITIRCRSLDTSGISKVVFDTFGVA